jgi:hypothetical protein
MAGDGSISFARFGHDWHSLVDLDEAFYLRVAAPGDYRYRGADLGVLLARGRMATEDGELTERCHAWLGGIRAGFAGVPVPPADEAPQTSLAFKGA